ncbi:hypothetical protein VNO80_22713 [Phaseolus coccineus]|uniref:Uncharacterized protein n=1 Tax=Phaseolus coccineus TaxID=3886 RepID=A0AAN9MAD1_PHACN
MPSLVAFPNKLLVSTLVAFTHFRISPLTFCSIQFLQPVRDLSLALKNQYKESLFRPEDDREIPKATAQNFEKGPKRSNQDGTKQLHNLIGRIPIEISYLHKLQSLNVGNKLTGRIPSFLGNLSALLHFSVGINNLEGEVPHELCRLKDLVWILVPINNLIGTFPSCFYNMSSLIVISATKNQFNGSLPPNMFHSLPNLKQFYIALNQVSCSNPPSITNASILSLLEIGANQFTGQVPALEKLQDLFYLGLSQNNVGDNSTNDLKFLKSFTNYSSLQMLDIFDNNFGGQLPNSLANLSTQLNRLYLGGKHTILFGITQRSSTLDLSRNNLSGSIPTDLQNISFLEYFNVSFNMLDGEVPTGGLFQNATGFVVNGNDNLCGVIRLNGIAFLKKS